MRLSTATYISCPAIHSSACRDYHTNPDSRGRSVVTLLQLQERKIWINCKFVFPQLISYTQPGSEGPSIMLSLYLTGGEPKVVQVIIGLFPTLTPLSSKVDHAASIGVLPKLHSYLPILHTHLHANVACPVSTMTTYIGWQMEFTEHVCGWSWLGTRIQATPMSASSGRQTKLQLL